MTNMAYVLQLLVTGLSTGALYAIIGVGFALVYSVLKFSNFSHGGAMVVSAYAGYFVVNMFGGNLWTTLLAAAAVGALINIMVEFISFRRLRRSAGSKQVFLFFVSSITMGMLLQNVIALKYSNIFYSFPNFFNPRYIIIGSNGIDIASLYMIAIAAVCLVILVLILKKTRLGISIRALSMDATTTSLMGINVDFVVVMTFVVAGILAAFAGVFVAIKTILSPQLGSLYTIKAFMVCVIGGLGSISGTLYAALILGMLETILTATIGSALAPVGTFLFMLIFLALFPKGIAGSFSVDKA